jgi:hypothetical protein
MLSTTDFEEPLSTNMDKITIIKMLLEDRKSATEFILLVAPGDLKTPFPPVIFLSGGHHMLCRLMYRLTMVVVGGLSSMNMAR